MSAAIEKAQSLGLDLAKHLHREQRDLERYVDGKCAYRCSINAWICSFFAVQEAFNSILFHFIQYPGRNRRYPGVAEAEDVIQVCLQVAEVENKGALCDLSSFTVTRSAHTELLELQFWGAQKRKGSLGAGAGRKKELPTLYYTSRVWFMSTSWQIGKAGRGWLIHGTQGALCRYPAPFESSIKTYKHWRLITVLGPSITDHGLFQKCYQLCSPADGH